MNDRTSRLAAQGRCFLSRCLLTLGVRCLIAAACAQGLTHVAAAQVAEPGPETPAELEAERDRLVKEVQRLDAEGKYAEAIVAVESILSVERRWLGEGHSDVFGSLISLAWLPEVLGDWPAAEERWKAALDWAETQRGAASWEAADARRGLELLTELKSWPKEKWQRWVAARLAMNRAIRTEDAGSVDDATMADAKHAVGVYRELFGAQSATYSWALSSYGGLLSTNGHYDDAVVVYREVVEVNKAALGPEHPELARALNYLGRALEASADYDGARRSFEECLAILSKIYGEDAEETLSPLNNLGTCAAGQGDLKRAKVYLERVYLLYVKYHGPESHEAAHAGSNVGVLLGMMGDYVKSGPYLEHTLTVYLKLYGENDWRTAEALANYGNHLLDMGDLKGARSYLERALAVERKVWGEHPKTAGTLHNLGTLLRKMGDLQGAKACLEEALAMKRKTEGEDHPDVAITLTSLAGVMDDLGDRATRRLYLEQALAIDEKAFGAININLGAELSNFGQLLKEEGDYEGALRYFERSLECQRSGGAEEHENFATTLGNIGGICIDLGDYTSARKYYEQALAIDRKMYGDSHPATAHALSAMGALASRMGDYDAAVSYYQQDLAIISATYGEGHVGAAHAMQGLATALADKGEYAKARPYQERALAIFQNVYGAAHPDSAGAEEGLAVILSNTDNDAAAMPYYLRSLEATRKASGDQHPDTAHAFGNLAVQLISMGDFAKARSYLEYALAVYRKAYGDEHPNVAWTRMRLGVLLEWMGEPAASEEMLRLAVESGQRLIQETAVASSEQEQMILTRSLREYLDYYVSCLLRRPGGAEAAYRAVLNWKGGALVRQRAERVAADQEELQPLFEELRGVVRQWTTLARKPEADVAAWQKHLDALRVRKDELAAELSRRSAEFRQATTAVSLADLDAALPADAALVDYLEFQFSEPYPGKKGTLRVRRSFVAFVVRPGRRVQMFDLGDSEPIGAAIDQWRTTMGMSAEARRAGALLRDSLWAPLAAAIGDATLVLISPDGALGKLPFAALPGSTPESYLIEEVAVVMVPVPQLLPALEADTALQELPSELLVLGGVDYDRRGPTSDDSPPATAAKGATLQRPWERRRAELAQRSILGDGQWAFLEGTDSELGYIRDLYYDATGLERGSDRIVALRGSEATEEAFRRLAPTAYLLHIATHGFFAEADKASALARGQPGESATEMFGAGSDAVRGFSPGMLSGLVLAGANVPPVIPDDSAELAAMPDDGYLTADEIAVMSLGGAQLVVLSACESGLGQTAGGEGMLGIQRAFQVAGARATIASLWKVNDEATRRIMEEFYRNYLEKKMSPLESLREAQRWALNNPELVPRGARPPDDAGGNRRLPPRYWAAFTLSGDWR